MDFFSHELSVNGGDAPRPKKQACSYEVAGGFFGVSPDHLLRVHKHSKKSKSFGTTFFFLLASLIFSTPAFSLSVPDKPSSYVNDYANLLSDTARGKLENELAAFEKETSNQVVVAIFPSLEGGSLEDFSIRLAEKWKLGTKDKDNGVILLIFKEDRAVRIEVGYGLEGALPDAVASLIIQNEIVPAFRAGDYDQGVLSAVSSIIQATKGEYKALPTKDKIKDVSPFLFMLLVFYLLFPILCYVAVVIGATAILGFPAGLLVGAVLAAFLVFLRSLLGASIFGQTLSGSRRGGFWGGSGGGFSGGFGGGFSGGGGGSFGGGGASGRW